MEDFEKLGVYASGYESSLDSGGFKNIRFDAFGDEYFLFSGVFKKK